MNAPEVAVIDYGIGNLLSVQRGLEHCGASVRVTADPEVILSASHVILPGVGAFANGMAKLRQRGFDIVIREIAARGVPLLGICLGMQMLLDESEEFGVSQGLGLIPGRVIQIPTTSTDGSTQKIPHIGWNALFPTQAPETWKIPLLQEVQPGEPVYFVHSFMAQLNNPHHLIAHCIYGGVQIAAFVGHNNIFGCQFHPEKSGMTGLKILRGFIKFGA